MFCCTKPNHQGQIVTSICEQQQCAKSQKQLCCSECIKQNHSAHSVTSMKKILPQLLNANNQKKFYHKLLEKLTNFLEEQFGNDQYYRSIVGTTKLNLVNSVQVVELMMLQLRKVNKQQNKKLRQIEKTLKINNENDQRSSPIKNLMPNYQSVMVRANNDMSRLRNYQSVPLSSSIISSIQTFSHTLKHAYVTVSPDMRSVFKSSQAGGYKLAALSASPIPSQADNVFFNLKVVKSTGNILLGLAIPQIIKQKQYLNCYGAGHGAYLMGQNGNDPLSSILFHHNDNVFNRKEIVGWNYKQGQILGIGIIKEQDVQLISFRKYHINSSGKPEYKKVQKQFTMPLWPKNTQGHKLHVIAILQSLNDQVQFIPTDE